jgi:DNA-binding CsgD family transcriptional regulator
LTLKKIASQLDLSPKTVSNYRDNIKAKLGLTNITELVRYATQWLLENH